MKRNHVLDRLEQMGLKVEIPPTATFYIWLDLSKLPQPLDNGLVSSCIIVVLRVDMLIVFKCTFVDFLRGMFEGEDHRRPWYVITSFSPFVNSSRSNDMLFHLGIFFDLNPSHRRDLFKSPCHHFVRLSFGPPLEQLDKGMFIRVACSI